MRKVISVLHQMKGQLDDDYTLYEDGEVVHVFDQNIYPGGQNKTEVIHVSKLSLEIKTKLLEAANEDQKEAAKLLLQLP